MPVDEVERKCDNVIFACLHNCSCDKDNILNPPYLSGPNTTVLGMFRFIPNFGSAALIIGRWIELTFGERRWTLTYQDLS